MTDSQFYLLGHTYRCLPTYYQLQCFIMADCRASISARVLKFICLNVACPGSKQFMVLYAVTLFPRNRRNLNIKWKWWRSRALASRMWHYFDIDLAVQSVWTRKKYFCFQTLYKVTILQAVSFTWTWITFHIIFRYRH